jgi:hypothetical protein
VEQRDWPHAGQKVDVDVETTPSLLLAVVDDVRPPEQLHLRVPVQRDGAPAPEVPIGAAVDITWTSSAGQHVLPSTLVALPRARVQLWKLAPNAAPLVLQRREFVRVPETLRVQLRRDEQLWVAGLCDLSEGGARCVVLTTNDLAEGDVLRIAISFEEQQLDLPAAVVGVERHDDRTTARLRFEQLGREADVLRHHVLEQQRRARAAGLR